MQIEQLSVITISTLAILYTFVSFITFVIYAIDKSAAKKGRWRTKERTLHLLSLFGGWPGAILAQRLFRHKTKKRDFRAVFWLTVIINIALLYGLMLSSGMINPVN